MTISSVSEAARRELRRLVRRGLRPSAGAVLASCLLIASLSGCQGLGAGGAEPTRVWVFGEQHDQRDQQRQVATEVTRLASAGTLGAVLLEMLEQGSGGLLPRDATETEVQARLGWRSTAWPWEAYAPVVMAAVRAGVPVWGANLPRSAITSSMNDSTLDGLVPEGVRQRLALAVAEGHCGLLPPEALPKMVRVQLARDRAMADGVLKALSPASGTTGGARPASVLLLTGSQHASRDRGVPLHLLGQGLPAQALRVIGFGPADDGLVMDERRAAERSPSRDHCAELRDRFRAKPPLAVAGAPDAPGSPVSPQPLNRSSPAARGQSGP